MRAFTSQFKRVNSLYIALANNGNIPCRPVSASYAKSRNIGYVSRLFIVFGALLAMLMLASLASAATIDVGSGYAYSTIQSGVAAASVGDSVHVHTGTYTLTSAITVDKAIKLYGDGANNTVIRVTDSTLSNSGAIPGYIILSGVNGAEVYGFSIVGPASSVSDQLSVAPTDYRTGVSILGTCQNIRIHDIYFTLLYGDAVKVQSASSLSYADIYNLVVLYHNHDGVQLWDGNYVRIHNNWINGVHNCGVRVARSTNIEVDHNTLTFYSTSGWTSLELEAALSNITMEYNVLNDLNMNYWAAACGAPLSGGGTAGGTPASGTTTLRHCIYSDSDGYTLTVSGYTPTLSDNTESSTWDVNAYGYNPASSGGGTSYPYNGSTAPSLVSPSNGASVTSTNGLITLTTANLNSTSYKFYVADDSGFTTNLTTYTSSTNTYPATVTNKTYYWRVSAHIDAGGSAGTWTANTSAWSFTVTGNTITRTGVVGYVYDATTGSPISSAVVYLVAQTGNWSTTQRTDASGYFQVDVPSSGVYYMTVSATGYQTTPVSLPIELEDGGSYATEEIALTANPSYFAPNICYIQIVLPWQVPFPGVQVDVYSSSSDTSPFDSKLTDANGYAMFELEKDHAYTVRYYDVDQGVNGETTVYGSDPQTQIWVWSGTPLTSNTTKPVTYAPSDVIRYGVAQNTYNLTHATINVSVTPILGTITAWNTKIVRVWDNNTTMLNAGGTPVYAYSVSGTGNESTTVIVPNNASYYVETNVRSSLLSSYVPYYAYVYIKGNGINPQYNYGWKDQWNYELIGIITMFLLAALFGKRNVGVCAIMEICAGFFYSMIGWFVWDTGGILMACFAILLTGIYLLATRD